MKPDFIGLGAQKCATAWIYNMLNDHPDIEMVRSEDGEKDLRFFSYFFDRGFEWYEKHFNNQKHGITGEYSTSYFCSSDAPERVYNYSPETRLVVSLRHPVERVFSNHKHEVHRGRISGKNLIFENALKNNPMYLYQSLYYTHLSRWLKYFDKKQVFIILVDDLERNPKETMHGLYEFLGVNSEHRPPMLYERIHESRVPKNKFLESSLKTTAGILKNIGGAGFVTYLKSKGVNRKVYRLNSKTQEDAFPSMKEETKAFLLKYFADENSKLSKLINRNLSAWDI